MKLPSVTTPGHQLPQVLFALQLVRKDFNQNTLTERIQTAWSCHTRNSGSTATWSLWSQDCQLKAPLPFSGTNHPPFAKNIYTRSNQERRPLFSVDLMILHQLAFVWSGPTGMWPFFLDLVLTTTWFITTRARACLEHVQCIRDDLAPSVTRFLGPFMSRLISDWLMLQRTTSYSRAYLVTTWKSQLWTTEGDSDSILHRHHISALINPCYRCILLQDAKNVGFNSKQ